MQATLRSRAILLPACLVAAVVGCHDRATSISPVHEAALLRRLFPAQAAEVLESARRFTPAPEGFVAERANAARDLTVVLPRDGAGAIRIAAPGGFEVRAREVGAAGAGTPVESALAYGRPGGTSYWTVVEGGVEEWLFLDGDAVQRSQAVAAWEIEGGRPRWIAGIVEIDDEAGVPRVRLSAPAGYAASHDGARRAVGVRLEVRGARVELSVDADREPIFVDPIWTAAASMSTTRSSHTATLLPSGKVLVAGGAAAATAEVYDPALDVWAATGAMSAVRSKHAATLLANGTLLVTGGAAAATAEIYDPATNQWSATGPMTMARSQHTATMLESGSVLLAGGIGAQATAEIYDPAQGAFQATGSLAAGRYDHGAVRLGGGEVLVLGGRGAANTSLASAEIFDPGLDTWTPTGPLVDPRSLHTVALLASGKVMAAGGTNWTTPTSGTTLKTVEIFDPGTGTWSTAAPMVRARSSHRMVLLANGDALVMGNFGPFGSTVERYRPSTDTWMAASSMTLSRFLHTTTLLADDTRVLVTGGSSAAPNAEIFTPLPLGAACTAAVAGDCISGSCADGVCCDTACAGGMCDACSIAAGAPADGTCVALDVCAPGACAGGACSFNCVTSADCASSGYCSAGTCAGKKPDGQPAGGPGECLSGSAADGICCDTICGGICLACTAARKGGGADGACGPILVGTDPDDECPDAGAASCGTNGLCDGQGSCQLYPSGTVCAPASCQGSISMQADLCDGAGTCVVSGTVDCGLSLCASGVCATSCASDAGCVAATAYCGSGGACVPKKAAGAPALGPNECLTGFAADGVCCDAACVAGACDACSVAAGAVADGTCTPLGGAPCDDGDACTTVDACQGSVCVGSAPKACPAADACHQQGMCDPVSGACMEVAKPNGTACDDGNPCTAGDACESGACKGVNELDYTPCKGGVCFAAKCTIDTVSGSSSSGGGDATGGAAGSGASGMGGADAAGGASGANGSDATSSPALVGSGCLAVSGSGSQTSRAPVTGLLLALIAGWQRRRRRNRG